MMREDDHRLAHPQACEEGELVQVLDDHVEGGLAAQPPVGGRHPRVVAEPTAHPPHADALDHLLGGRTGEVRREERHLVARRDEAAEDLEAVDLGAARLRVVEVALVQQEDAPSHSRPSRCATRSHQTIHRASSPMRFDIFDSPSSRSMKMIGSSRMRSPRFQAR